MKLLFFIYYNGERRTWSDSQSRTLAKVERRDFAD